MNNTTTESVNGFLALYNGKQLEIRGEGLTLYAAKLQAIKGLKVPKSKQHMISIALCERDGAPVMQSTSF